MLEDWEKKLQEKAFREEPSDALNNKIIDRAKGYFPNKSKSTPWFKSINKAAVLVGTCTCFAVALMVILKRPYERKIPQMQALQQEIEMLSNAEMLLRLDFLENYDLIEAMEKSERWKKKSS